MAVPLAQSCLLPPIPGFDCDVLPYPGAALRVAIVVVLALGLGFGLLNVDSLNRWVRSAFAPRDRPSKLMTVAPEASSAATAPPVDAASVRLPARQWFGATLPGSDPPAAEIAGWDGKLTGLSAIKAHDHSFEEGGFLAATQRVFFAVLEAWTRLKPELSQGVMHSVIWEQQRSQIARYRQRSRRNVLENLALMNTLIVGAQSDTRFDSITVRMSARSADYDIEAASGSMVRGDTQMLDWVEDWIFQRPSTASSPQAGGTISQPCPNCGARVAVDITTVCPYCDAPVISGRFGWLLTRIDRV